MATTEVPPPPEDAHDMFAESPRISEIASKYSERKAEFVAKVRRCAAKLVAEEDVWGPFNIPAIPAERIIRHEYDPVHDRWSEEETIVKMEKEPFTHGAMRYCYRMKKLATPPKSASYHRFYKYGWSRASNYVAKAYICEQTDPDADTISGTKTVDTSEAAKEAVRNDIKLQYEANYWSQKFNASDPPKKINFIRAWAMEMPDREGHPWFAIERFIAGKDSYGATFVKHNTNSGFVDLDLHRVTPQVFSAHSFYASNGTRLVADIQGVGDLFTDPQVLSNDYRFGEGDLGPRGMALFFKTFRHNSFSDSMGIPIFPLSKNELKHQAKYSEDEDTVSSTAGSALVSAGSGDKGGLLDDDGSSIDSDAVENAILCRFAALDMNRINRQTVLHTPMQSMNKGSPAPDDATEKRSNIATTPSSVSAAIRKSLKVATTIKMPNFKRTASDVDEIFTCFQTAMKDPVYDHKAFHRLATGALRERGTHEEQVAQTKRPKRRQTIMQHTVQPMIPNEQCKANLGRVHYHLACLHGIGRFPEVVPDHPSEDGSPMSPEDKPAHDVFSVVFHLCHAASLRDVPACLALARVRAGLDSTVSNLLKTVVPVDFESAKDLLGRAMESVLSPAPPKAAAGCLLLQILEDEGEAGDMALAHVIQDTLEFMASAEEEQEERLAKRAVDARGGGIHVGDRVEANFCLEGNYYPGVVTAVSEDGKSITVQYDDDGSSETLTEENVRILSGASNEKAGIKAGDKVEANFCMEGTYYSAVVTAVSDNGKNITVQYDDDGSSETLTNDNVQVLGGAEDENKGPPLPPVGCPLTDEEALGKSNDDEICLYEAYALKAKLAALKVKLGEKAAAASLYQEAADAAMTAGKMSTAAQWSAKAAELE